MSRWSVAPNLALLTILIQSSVAQRVISYKGSETNLKNRWMWAKNESARLTGGESFWIAYSIERLMDENSFITTGMHFSGSIEKRANLYDLILDGKEDTTLFSNRSKNKRGFSMIMKGRRTPFKVMKDVGIFIRCSADRIPTVDDVQISNLELNLNLNKEKLFWLGPAQDDESVGILEGLFRSTKNSGLKENIVNAVGVHQQSDSAFQLLKEILISNEPTKVRSEAAGWLADQPREEALSILVNVTQSDAPKEVKEQSVFAISQTETESALDQLINLVLKARDIDVRRKATFWLGQKASRKAIATLEGMLADDEDTEVQKQALFALSRDAGELGVRRIIDVARNHPKMSIRKQAIITLGQSDDPRAREALIEIAKGK